MAFRMGQRCTCILRDYWKKRVDDTGPGASLSPLFPRWNVEKQPPGQNPALLLLKHYGHTWAISSLILFIFRPAYLCPASWFLSCRGGGAITLLFFHVFFFFSVFFTFASFFSCLFFFCVFLLWFRSFWAFRAHYWLQCKFIRTFFYYIVIDQNYLI